MPHTASPLDQLQEMMAGDMARVNEIIMARMHSDVPLIPQLAGYLIASGEALPADDSGGSLPL